MALSSLLGFSGIIPDADVVVGSLITRAHSYALYHATVYGQAAVAKVFHGRSASDHDSSGDASGENIASVDGTNEIASFSWRTKLCPAILPVSAVVLDPVTAVPRIVVMQPIVHTLQSYLDSLMQPVSPRIIQSLLFAVLQGVVSVHACGGAAGEVSPRTIAVIMEGNTPVCRLSGVLPPLLACRVAFYPPLYTPPEVRAGRYIPRSDVYSFGVLVCEVALRWLGHGVCVDVSDGSATKVASLMEAAIGLLSSHGELKVFGRIVKRSCVENETERCSVEDVIDWVCASLKEESPSAPARGAENVRHLDSGGLDLCKVVGVLDSLKLAEGVVDGVMERLAHRPASTIDELFDVLMKSGVSVANGYRIKNAATDLKLFPARERDVHPMPPAEKPSESMFECEVILDAVSAVGIVEAQPAVAEALFSRSIVSISTVQAVLKHCLVSEEEIATILSILDTGSAQEQKVDVASIPAHRGTEPAPAQPAPMPVSSPGSVSRPKARDPPSVSSDSTQPNFVMMYYPPADAVDEASKRALISRIGKLTSDLWDLEKQLSSRPKFSELKKMGSKLRGMFGSLLGDSGHRPSLQRSLLPDAPQISEEELQFRIRDVRNELVSARIAAQKAGVYLPLKGRSEAMFRLPAALSSGNRSIAVSPLGTMLVVANVDNHSVSAYELPSGAFCFESGQGGPSKDPAAFNWPARVVYTKSGNLLVAERMNKRVQEFGPTHSVLRLIGVDVIPEPILSMDASESLIVVACQSQGDSVLLFDYSSGSLVHTFSLNISGALACKSVRISPDHQHILTVDLSSNGILVYSLEGDFVMSFGGKVLDAPQDLVVTDFGDIVVADCNHNRICVFSGTTLELLSSWGHEGVGLGCFMKPTALAFFGGRLYVADYFSDRIQVFT